MAPRCKERACKVRVARLLVLLLFLYAIVAPFRASGDDVSGVVRGYVHDINNRPLRGTRVFLQSSESPMSIRTTDNTGRFTFLAVLPGDYIVTASKDGYCGVTPAGARHPISESIARKVIYVEGQVNSSPRAREIRSMDGAA